MERISCDKELIKEYIWKIMMALLIFEKSLGLSSSSKLHNVYNLSGMLMLMGMLVVILMTKYTLRQYIVFLLMCAVCGMVTICSHKTTMIFPVFAIYAAKDIRMDNYWDIIKWVWTAGFLTAVIMNVIGVRESNIIMQYRFFGSKEDSFMRGDLGYGHPNTLYAVVDIMIILWSFTPKRPRWYIYVVMSIINILIYCITLSSGGVVIGFLAIICSACMKHISKKMICVVSVIPCIVTMVCSIIYNHDNDVWYAINDVLSGRLNMVHEYLYRYGVKFFGQMYSGAEYYMCDNAYMNILLQLGIVMWLIIAVVYCVTIRKAYINNDKRSMLICAIMLVYAFIEQFFQNCFMNVSFLVIVEYFWSRDKWNINEYDRCKDSVTGELDTGYIEKGQGIG